MKWYYLHKGRPCGPVFTNELRELVASRQLGPFDLVYEDGSPKWERVIDVQGLQEVLLEMPHEEDQGQWVILKRVRQGGGSKFLQDGPFRTEQVKKKVYSGELSYRDYAWKKGMREWYLIASLEEFNQKENQVWRPKHQKDLMASVDEAEVTLSALQIKSILESVETVTLPYHLEDDVPAEVEGPDLTQLEDVEGYLIEHKKSLGASPELSGETEKAKEKSLVSNEFEQNEFARWVFGVIDKGKQKSPLFYFNFLLFFVMVGLVITLWEVRKTRSLPDPVSTPQIAKKKNKKSKVDRSQEKSSRFKKSTRRHKVLPKTNFLSVKSKRSNIFIETDAHQDKKITVSIFANGGQALSERGIYRWRQDGAGKKVRISLDEMKLVPGEYLVVVNVDHLSRRLRVSHRAGSAKFKRQLLGYKKLMSFYHQQEKHQLRPLLAKVQKEAESLLKSMNANVAKRKKAQVYKAWLKEYRRVSRRVFPKAKKARLKRALYPEYWWELKMAWKKVGWVATEYSKSYENPRGELKKNFQKTLTQISRLKKDVDSLSLF